MNSLKAFFTQKSTILAFMDVLVYQVLMMGIFLPAYTAIPQNISNLQVGIVNEDTNYGAEIEKQMLEELPFIVETKRSLEEAQRSLEDRDIYLQQARRPLLQRSKEGMNGLPALLMLRLPT